MFHRTFQNTSNSTVSNRLLIHAVTLFILLCRQILIAFPLESTEGHYWVLVVYFAGVLFGAIGNMIFNPTQTIMGASGGVYSLLLSHLSQCTLVSVLLCILRQYFCILFLIFWKTELEYNLASRLQVGCRFNATFQSFNSFNIKTCLLERYRAKN